MGLLAEIKKKKYEILAFLVGTVIVGTVLAVGQEALKQRFLGTGLRIRPLESASGVFVANLGLCVRQISAYEVSATGLVKDISVTITFPDQTKVVGANVIYTVAWPSFAPACQQTNTLEFKLSRQLDTAKRAQIFLTTERPFRSTDRITSELPDIHVEGKDKNGNVVYN